MRGLEQKPQSSTGARLRTLLPEVWALVRPHASLFAFGSLLMLLNRAAGLVLPAATKFVIDDVVLAKRAELLPPLILAVLAGAVVHGVTSFALFQLHSKAAQRLITELREKVQRHVGRLPLSFFDVNTSGALVSRILNDVDGLRNLIGSGFMELAGSLLSALLAFVLMFKISPTMTLLTAASVAVCVSGLLLAMRTLRPIFRQRGEIQAEVTGRLAESLSGIRVVKGYHQEASEAETFSRGVRRLLANMLHTLTAVSMMSLGVSILIGLVSATVIYFGAHGILAGAMTVGSLFTYIVLVGFLMMPVLQIVAIGTQLSEALAGLERTRQILLEKPEDADTLRSVALTDLRGDVVFEDVVFEYEPGHPVIRGISFAAPPGSVTALAGPSGAGKSTTIGLVAAFYNPSAGRILVDGVDLSTVRLDSYRPRLGVVLQETFLFDGTIRENVAFSRPEATDGEVFSACRIARVDAFALSFEKKYDTVVGERGVKLSGGQRQRVAIARAILADPRILILDEATSSLDSESEAFIQEGLAHLMRGRTTFVIAHRLSTIRQADQILVLDDGRVVERGDHEALYAAGARYYEMVTRQRGLADNLFLAPGEGREPVARQDVPAPTRSLTSWVSPL